VSDEDFDHALEAVLDPAFRLAMTMLKERTAAEEAALKAWRARARFRAGSEFRPWLLSIVANECRTARRGRWWRVARVADVFGGRRPESRLEDRLDLERALDMLPQQHLLLLTLYYHLDLPIGEVARVLGCSEGAARVRIHRALNALRPSMVMEADA